MIVSSPGGRWSPRRTTSVGIASSRRWVLRSSSVYVPQRSMWSDGGSPGRGVEVDSRRAASQWNVSRGATMLLASRYGSPPRTRITSPWPIGVVVTPRTSPALPRSRTCTASGSAPENSMPQGESLPRTAMTVERAPARSRTSESVSTGTRLDADAANGVNACGCVFAVVGPAPSAWRSAGLVRRRAVARRLHHRSEREWRRRRPNVRE